MGFKQAQQETIAAIPWLGNDRGVAFEGVIGAERDAELDRLKDAAKMAASPFLCPDDALDAMGVGFGIQRYPGEPNGTVASGWRGRLCSRWTTAKLASTPISVEASIVGYGIPDVHAYNYDEWPSAEAWVTKCYLFLGPNYGTTGIAEQLWGSINWGDPAATWGSTATPAQVATIKAQFLKLKWAYSLPVEIVLRFPTTSITAISPVGLPTFTGAPPCVWTLVNLWGAPWLSWGACNWQNGTW
jgi:hypothetical protein